MIWSLDHQSPLRELVKWFLTSGVTGTPAFPACGRAAAQRGRKNEKISKKNFFQNFFFPKFVLSSHLLVNLPKKTLNLRPLDKLSLKNGFLVEKNHFFAKFFRDIFFKSTTCAPNFRKLNIESGSTAHEGPNQKSGSVTNRDMVLTNQ